MTRLEYFSQSPPGTRLGAKSSPFHLYTQDGVPFTEVKYFMEIRRESFPLPALRHAARQSAQERPHSV